MKFLALACLFSLVALGEQSTIPAKVQELKVEDIQLLQKISEVLQKNSASLKNDEATGENQVSSNTPIPLSRLPESPEELEFLQKVADFLQNYQLPSSPLPEEPKTSPGADQGVVTKALFDAPFLNCPGYQMRDVWGRCRPTW